MKVSELIEQLQTRYKPDTVLCAPIWLVEDVQCQAEAEGVTLTENECALILERMEDNQDACLGVNWDTISAWIDYHEREKE